MIIDFRMRIPPREQFSDNANQLEIPDYMQRYMRLYNIEETLKLDSKILLESMESTGVVHGVLQAEYEFGDYKELNQKVKSLTEKHRDKLTGFITVNPSSDDDPVEVLEQALNWGCKGVNLQPWSYQRRLDDPYFYPLYEVARDNGLIVTAHTSINFSVNSSIDYGRPIYLDKVACDFPQLKIVANHGGWPWVTEMVAIAWKHPQVYIELGGVSPKYIGKTGTGWEPILVYGNSLLKRQLLFATDWPLIDFTTAIEGFSQLPFKEDVKRRILSENARELLEI